MEDLGRKHGKGPQQSIRRSVQLLAGDDEEHPYYNHAVTSWEKASGIVVDPEIEEAHARQNAREVLWIGAKSGRTLPSVRSMAGALTNQVPCNPAIPAAPWPPPLLPHEQLFALQSRHRIDASGDFHERVCDGPSYSSGNWGSHVVAPRFYACSFCAREFGSAQALGGHMNVHRHERAHLVAIAAAAAESSNDRERAANDSGRHDAAHYVDAHNAVKLSPLIDSTSASCMAWTDLHPRPYHAYSILSSSSSCTSPPGPSPSTVLPTSNQSPCNAIYPGLSIHPPSPSPPHLDLELHLGRMPVARSQH